MLYEYNNVTTNTKNTCDTLKKNTLTCILFFGSGTSLEVKNSTLRENLREWKSLICIIENATGGEMCNLCGAYNAACSGEH